MILITQLVYIKEGQEQVFDEFESVALPAILKYNGRLLLRVRPTAESYIESPIDPPYEIHLVEFATQKDFEDFLKTRREKNSYTLKNSPLSLQFCSRGRNCRQQNECK